MSDFTTSGVSTPNIETRSVTVVETHVEHAESTQSIGGLQFWLIFASLMVSVFLSALDLTSVATALPTIVDHLHGDGFVWVGSAYALASTAILPLVGGLAQIFGRRPVLLSALFLFTIGSAISGSAVNMSMLIAGRTIQGLGGGSIESMTAIIVADLVPLRKRGAYMGLIGAVWAIASAIGPPIGGAFSESSWRWLFYMNLPLCAIAITLVMFFLKLKTPQEDLKSKVKRIDWIGNFIVIVSTTITAIALTWAGVQHPWTSYQVLVPLILGILGLFAFFYYEFNYAVEPVIPPQFIKDRTSLLGYTTVFLHGLAVTTVIYYLPVYFQGSKLQSPVKSGVSIFGNAFTIAPAAIICGMTVAVFRYYKPQNFLGWAFSAIGVGLLTLLKADSPKTMWILFQIVEGLGFGLLYTGPTFPVLAPLPLKESAHALAFFTFVRAYAQTWGITIGATILQNQLRLKLPQAFLDSLSNSPSHGVEIAYSAIPVIPSLSEPLRTEVRAAFAQSVRVIWIAMIPFCVVGFLCVLGMKEIPMHETTDEDWGMEARPPAPPADEKA